MSSPTIRLKKSGKSSKIEPIEGESVIYTCAAVENKIQNLKIETQKIDKDETGSRNGVNTGTVFTISDDLVIYTNENASDYGRLIIVLDTADFVVYQTSVLKDKDGTNLLLWNKFSKIGKVKLNSSGDIINAFIAFSFKSECVRKVFAVPVKFRQNKIPGSDKDPFEILHNHSDKEQNINFDENKHGEAHLLNEESALILSY